MRLFVSVIWDGIKILPDSNQPAPEVCISQSLESKANTPEADENKEKSKNDGEDDETKANTQEVDENEDKRYDGKDGGTETETDQDDTISTVANHTTSGKSKYSPFERQTLHKIRSFLVNWGFSLASVKHSKQLRKFQRRMKKRQRPLRQQHSRVTCPNLMHQLRRPLPQPPSLWAWMVIITSLTKSRMR